MGWKVGMNMIVLLNMNDFRAVIINPYLHIEHIYGLVH